MDIYADALELASRALTHFVAWALVAVAAGAGVVAILGTQWLGLVAAGAPLAPLLAVAVTVRSHAAVIRERQRRAAYVATR